MKAGFYTITYDGKPSVAECIHEDIDGNNVVYCKIIGSENIFEVDDLDFRVRIEIDKSIEGLAPEMQRGIVLITGKPEPPIEQNQHIIELSRIIQDTEITYVQGLNHSPNLGSKRKKKHFNRRFIK